MPKLERSVRGPARLGRRATPTDFETGIGLQALGTSIAQAGDATERILHAEMESKVSAAVQNAATRLNDIRLEEQANPDYESSEERFTKQRTELLNGFREGIFSTRYKNLFDDRVFAIGERTRLQVADNVRARRLDATRANAVTAHGKLVELAATADTPEMRETYLEQAKETLRGGVSSGAISKTQEARMGLAADAAMRDAEHRHKAQAAADEIMAKHDTPQARLDAARKLKGELRDRVVARIKDRNAEEEQQRTRRNRAILNQAGDQAWAGDLTHEQVIDLPLDKGAKDGLHQIIAKLQSGQGTDWGVYYELRSDLTSPATREEARRINYSYYRPALADKEYKEILKLAEAEDADALDDFDSKVDAILSTLDLPVTDAGMRAEPKKGKKTIAFRQRVDAERKRRVGVKEGALNSTELDEVISYGLEPIRMRGQGWFSDPVVSRFLMSPDDVSDVPDEDATMIRATLLSRGREPTAELILDTYREQLMLQRTR